ncbi:hypothetical protein [Streptomyces hiroshimensis]|uniref:Uncharacterized protein n=1 Tax=Streptomyces hiroshimensis TaxID=66424 RepID=A0ABQ2YB36_9ACTN|nr:hypothetical protein [Streptomyces hiroshimensis]GGX76330.1 hypothetical protein GCM10010324_22500 [Streptomyces hiroshimensis]
MPAKDRGENAAARAARPAPIPAAPAAPAIGRGTRPADRILSLQHTAGNAAVAQLHRVIHQEPSYIAKAGDRTSLTNRGDIDTEERGGKLYVRVYQTVFAPVTGGRHKDVQQRADGSIDFINQQDSAWLNMGRPWRAMHYMRTYQDQKNRKASGGNAPSDPADTSMVRTFLIPIETYRQVTENAVSEQQIGATADARNTNQSTDKAKDTDQYEVRGGWMKEVTRSAVPNSLVTYVPDGLAVQLKNHPGYGEVRPVSDLLAKLSMPDFEDFPEYRPASNRAGGLVLPLNKKGKMRDEPEQLRHIERLEKLVNDAFLESGETHRKATKDAREKLKRLAGVEQVNDRDIDWEALHQRVQRAMNYAGVPAVLAEVYNKAKDEAAQGDGGGFKVRDFTAA